MIQHRAIIHLDLDAFYASVEQRDDPSLRGKPVIVGGHPTRGVVLAASYEVRPYGVKSAMPMAWALARAPSAIVRPPRFSAYQEASERVFAILESVTPLVEPLSLDEAFLDVTASRGLFGAPSAIAKSLRERIRAEVGLAASAGIATGKLLAKLATDLAKPDGQREVPADQVTAFLHPLSVERLWGVGPKSAERLAGIGLRTVGDVARADLRWLVEKLGPGAEELRRMALGEDEREVVPDRAAKSIGAEDTFEEDLQAHALLEPKLHAQALRVGRRLRHAGVKTRVVQLKLKLSDFQLITRRTTLLEPTDDGQALYRTALALLHKEHVPKPVRLCGIAAQELRGSSDQLGLFSPEPSASDALNRMLDRISQRFGEGAVKTADLADDVPDRWGRE